MAKTKYRLLRLNHSAVPLSYDYLASYSVGSDARFTPDVHGAHLFPTWAEFVAAVVAIWLSDGPCDLMYEQVSTTVWEDFSNAGTAV